MGEQHNKTPRLYGWRILLCAPSTYLQGSPGWVNA